MFCPDCGTNLSSNIKFCPKCGLPNASYGGAAGKMPPQNTSQTASPGRGASQSANMKIGTMLGIAGAMLALFSLFLPFVKSSSVSANLFDWMRMEYPKDGFVFSIIPIIGILLIAVFHLIKRPKLSVIGIIALLFTFVATLVLFGAEGYKGQGLSIGFGVWLLLAAVAACLVAAFVKSTSSISLSWNAFIGILGAAVALFCVFLPYLSVSAGSLKISLNFYDTMREEDGTFLCIIAIISSILVAVLQGMKHPKLSLVGSAGLLFVSVMGILWYFINEYHDRFGYSLSFGIWLMLLATIATIAAAFMKKNS